MRGPLVAIGFGCAVGLAILYAGELALRLTAPDPGLRAIEQAAAAGRPFDSRTRREVVADLNTRGRDAVPRLVPSGLLQEGPQGEMHSRLTLDGTPASAELLPLAGISRHTTVLCNETGEWAVYDSDEHGFRNPAGIWRRVPAELVLLGDSFTIGECVQPGRNVADRLRERHPRTVNLGYSGNSPLLELAALVEYGPSLRPRTVLWLYFENDLSWFDLGQSRRTPLLMRYLEPGPHQDLLSLQPAIDRRLEELLGSSVAQPDDHGPVTRLADRKPDPGQRLLDFATLRTLRRRFAGLRGAVRPRREPPDYALFTRVLERARQVTAGWGGELVLVYLPGVWNFDPHSRGPAFADPEGRERLREIARSLDLRFVDVQEAVARHEDPLSLYSYRGDSILGSPHMNGDGYALVAATVEEALSPADSSERETSSASARRSQISRQ